MDTLFPLIANLAFVRFTTLVYFFIIFNTGNKLLFFIIKVIISFLTVILFPENPEEITSTIIYTMLVGFCNKLRIEGKKSKKPYISALIATALSLFAFTQYIFYDTNHFVFLLLVLLSILVLVFNQTVDFYIDKLLLQAKRMIIISFTILKLQEHRKYRE